MPNRLVVLGGAGLSFCGKDGLRTIPDKTRMEEKQRCLKILKLDQEQELIQREVF